MNTCLEQLVSSAILAPSGDNTQPWRFEVDSRAQRIDIYLDPMRDPSPMNSGQRMARIAIGAALENLVQAVLRSGCSCEIEAPPSGALARVRLSVPDGVSIGVGSAMKARVTNRRRYDGRSLPNDFVETSGLEGNPVEGVSTHWIVDRARIGLLALLIGRGDALMFGEPSMLKAFLAKVRFDAPPNAVVDDGLCLGSLEAKAPDRLAMRLMRRMPDRMLGAVGLSRIFDKNAQTLVNSASGLCLVVTADDSESSDVQAGRAMQRAWLSLTAEGLAVQPMMSLLVLENVSDNGSSQLVESLGEEKLATLREELRGLVPEIGNGRPAVLLRFGYADEPSGRTGRLPVGKVTAETDS